jgi:hypothetical protein
MICRLSVSERRSGRLTGPGICGSYSVNPTAPLSGPGARSCAEQQFEVHCSFRGYTAVGKQTSGSLTNSEAGLRLFPEINNAFLYSE